MARTKKVAAPEYPKFSDAQRLTVLANLGMSLRTKTRDGFYETYESEHPETHGLDRDGMCDWLDGLASEAGMQPDVSTFEEFQRSTVACLEAMGRGQMERDNEIARLRAMVATLVGPEAK